jgi:hypothetical protein
MDIIKAFMMIMTTTGILFTTKKRFDSQFKRSLFNDQHRHFLIRTDPVRAVVDLSFVLR